MLYFSIAQDAYDALPDDVKVHYVKRGKNYVLDTGGENPELAATQTQLDQANRDLVTVRSQVRTLEQGRADFENNLVTANKTEMDSLRETNASLTNTLVSSEVDRQITAIAGNFGSKFSKLIASDIKANSRVEGKVGEDGKVQLVYKNVKGEEVTFDALKDEYCKNPEYSDMLSTAQNTGTMSPPAGNSNNPMPAGDGKLDYNKATPAQLAARAAQIN